VCDVDGDGVLTSRDLRFFYDDQARRMRDHGMEVVKFEDILCQLHDLLKPRVEGRILLSDFTRPDRIKLTGVLFNALFDLDKFQRFEGREPAFVKQVENYTLSQWDRYAAIEYQRLASEEEDAQSLVVGGGVGAASNIGGWGP
jgi:serine/threonine-protein phosphatase 2A regulatory subunit B''